MSINFKSDPTLSAEPFPSAPAEKDIITLLGVQGLSHNDYSIVELKVMLQLIKHAQKVIVNYVIPQRVSHNGFSIHVNLTHLQAYLLSLIIGMIDDF